MTILLVLLMVVIERHFLEIRLFLQVTCLPSSSLVDLTFASAVKVMSKVKMLDLDL